MAGPDDPARRLPFAVDDYAAAGEAFAAWRRSGHTADHDAVTLWAYCYVRRHLAARFAHERTSSPADFDAAMSRAFGAVLDGLGRVAEPERFPHYVSVICKRTVWRHREQRQVHVEADEGLLPGDDDAAPAPYASAVVRADVLAAIAALPHSLAEVARLRVVEGMDYEAIADATGRPIASVRTYAARAVARLRDDPRLRAHFYDDLLPPAPDDAPTARSRATASDELL